MASNGKPDFLKYYLEHDEEELLAYFPEYQQEFDKLDAQFDAIADMAQYHVKRMYDLRQLPRGDFARMVFSRGIPKYLQSYVFKNYEDPTLTWGKYTQDWDYHKWKNFLETAEGDLQWI
jgi:hypothetical protein